MSNRLKILVGVSIIAVVALGAGLAIFEPWTAFTNKTVNETAPTLASTSMQSGGSTQDTTGTTPQYPKVLARGELIAQSNHSASGSVSIIETAAGTRILRFENLDTDNGPDLKVWLTDQAVAKERGGVFDDGNYVDLGALKGNRGNQNYDIPASADLASLTSVSIWCDRFNVSFGAAPLTPA